MKILLGHGFREAPSFGTQWIEDWLARLRAAGYDVEALRIDLPVPGGRLAWPELERRWRRGDRPLLEMYETIARACEGADVLVNYGGLNLHPDFLAQLSTVSALAFFDDPENSEAYSRHVAAGHDLCLVGNIAALDAYRSWGVRDPVWWPLGFRADDYDPALTEQDILERDRPVEVALLCERVTHWRRANVDRFARAFPRGVYRGRGWAEGFLPESERIPLLQRTQVGINMHNSTGPINFRTFYLPANGVMQLCDNRRHLGGVFSLDAEVVGYETVDEAIERCRYYLDHPDERRKIAAAGFRRAHRDYNEVAVFQRLVDAVKPLVGARRAVGDPTAYLATHRQQTSGRRMLHYLASPVSVPSRAGLRVIKGVYRRALRWRDNALHQLSKLRAPD